MIILFKDVPTSNFQKLKLKECSKLGDFNPLCKRINYITVYGLRNKSFVKLQAVYLVNQIIKKKPMFRNSGGNWIYTGNLKEEEYS